MPAPATALRTASSQSRHQQPREKHRRQTSRARLLRGVGACDVAMNESPTETVLIAAATGFASGIESGDRFTLHVDDLRSPVDSQAAIRIVPHRIECRGVERRSVDLIHRGITPTRKLGIAAFVDVRIPLLD